MNGNADVSKERYCEFKLSGSNNCVQGEMLSECRLEKACDAQLRREAQLVCSEDELSLERGGKLGLRGLRGPRRAPANHRRRRNAAHSTATSGVAAGGNEYSPHASLFNWSRLPTLGGDVIWDNAEYFLNMANTSLESVIVASMTFLGERRSAGNDTAIVPAGNPHVKKQRWNTHR